MNRIESWLWEARWAPSAANCQPWRVLADDRGHEVAFRLELAPSFISKQDPLDPSFGGAVIALGTLAETLEHIAAVHDFRLARCEFSESGELKSGAVTLVFSKVPATRNRTSSGDELAAQIQRRRTHREPMSRKALDERHRQIPHAINSDGFFAIREFGQSRLEVARVLGRLDRIRCENKELFSTLLGEVRFSGQDRGETGLPIETLGISFAGRCWLKLCFAIPWLQNLFKFGVHHVFTTESLIRPIRNSAHLYCIIAQDNRFQDWYKMGKFIQRIWLEFTREGVGLQPLAMSILAHACRSHSNEVLLSPKQMQTIREVEAELAARFSVDFAKPCIFLRAGYMKQLPPVSPRQVISYVHQPGLGEVKGLVVTS